MLVNIIFSLIIINLVMLVTMLIFSFVQDIQTQKDWKRHRQNWILYQKLQYKNALRDLHK